MVTATYPKDFISRTTDSICGPYSIDVKFSSSTSTLLGGPIDTSLTDFVAIDANNLKFIAN